MRSGAIFDMDGLLFGTERFYRKVWLDVARSLDNIPAPPWWKLSAAPAVII